MEIVVMGLELLADGVTLALQRFAPPRVDAHQPADAIVNAQHIGVPAIEIAAVAGPKIVLIGAGPCAIQLGRDRIGIDHADELRAFAGGHEILIAIDLHRDLHIVERDALDARMGIELVAHVAADPGQFAPMQKVADHGRGDGVRALCLSTRAVVKRKDPPDGSGGSCTGRSMRVARLTRKSR